MVAYANPFLFALLQNCCIFCSYFIVYFFARDFKHAFIHLFIHSYSFNSKSVMQLADRVVAVDESDVSFMAVVAMLEDVVDTFSVLTTSVVAIPSVVVSC